MSSVHGLMDERCIYSRMTEYFTIIMMLFM